MQSTASLIPAVLAGFVAVLVGYASSAAIIWQAAAAAGASTQQIAGWMTALGLGMGISTLVLSWWYKAPRADRLVDSGRGVARHQPAWRDAGGNHRGIYIREYADSAVRRHRPVCPVDETDPALACRRYAGGRAVTVWPEGIQQS